MTTVSGSLRGQKYRAGHDRIQVCRESSTTSTHNWRIFLQKNSYIKFLIHTPHRSSVRPSVSPSNLSSWFKRCECYV